MNTQEMSNTFDVLINSFATSAPFGQEASGYDLTVDEYDKSIYLTKAQEEEILDLYNGNNIYGEGFEGNEEIRRLLSSLVKTAQIEPIADTSNLKGISANSKFFTLPANPDPAVWVITYEAVNLGTPLACSNITTMDVYPTTQDEYHKIKKNPFRGSNKHRALRLDYSDTIVEIICSETVSNYYIKYLTWPAPIILTEIEDEDYYIHGEHSIHDCELPEALHQRIVERAVRLALQTKGKVNSKDSN